MLALNYRIIVSKVYKYTKEIFMKKFFLLVFVIPAITFTSCSKKTENVSTVPAAKVVTMASVSFGPVPAGIKEVEGKINEIIEPLINARMNFLFLDGGSYADQINLMMSSGEKLDLLTTMPFGPIGIVSMASQNQLMDIGGLLDQYGKELKASLDGVMPNLLRGTTMNGKVIAVTSLFNKVGSHYWCIRTDLLEKHNISVDNIRTIDDIERILERMKLAEPDMAPVTASGSEGYILTLPGIFYDNDISSAVIYDFLGEPVNILGITFKENITKVVNRYKTEEYKKTLTRMRRWYQNGYIYKDAATTIDSGETVVKNGKAFSWFVNSELGVEASKKALTGYDITAIKLVDQMVSTGDVTKFGWGVPVQSKEAEAAVKLLNLMYSDARIANLLAWGIEGRDYVSKSDGTVGYPPGLGVGGVPYHSVDFIFGNQFLCKPWEGSPSNIREQARVLNRSASTSEILGFTFNSNSVMNEISSISNVVSQYRKSLDTGTVDPERELPNFIRALDAAGADKVIAEMQKQLDTWKASN
jgi:putative aldouronate transport system substrate-binding protein